MMSQQEITEHVRQKSTTILKWYVDGYRAKLYRLQPVEHWILQAAEAELKMRGE